MATTSDETDYGTDADPSNAKDVNEPVKPGDQSKVPKEARGKKPSEMAKRWETELQAAKKELSKFHTTAKKLVRRYLDDRDSAAMDGSEARFNLFWSNVEVLKASLYARPPDVDVSNAYKDGQDDVSRVACNILQRMLNNDLEDSDESTYPDITKQAVGDYLVVGLGQVWYRYEVETEENETEPVVDPMTGQVLAEGVEYEAVIGEDAPADYVYWEDFWWSPARVWQDVRWVARRVYMNREELCARFGQKIGKTIPVSKVKHKTDGPQNDPWEKAGVFEIWDKTTQCAYWHVMGFDVICDYKKDPLGLRGFFPCPPPLMANLATTTYMPRADYLMAQDQYAQIDEITTRLKYLIEACKVIGVYDKNSTPIGRVFMEGLENQMIPVDNWAAFAEKGGLKGQLDFVPIDVIATVIGQLTEQREVLKANLYEVLGIGDIMRGMTDPDETLGAQQLKAQFGGNRLQFKQQAIGEWVGAGQRIRAQIISDKFQPDTIMQRSNIMLSPDAALAQQAVEFLKAPDNSKFYRISIEAESMAMVDQAQERDSRVQFMEAMTGFIGNALPMVQAKPEVGPSLWALVKFTAEGFRVSKEIQTVLDELISAAGQPTPPPTPSPMEQAEVREKDANTVKSKTQAVKNLAEASQKGVETQMAGMVNLPMPGTPGPGGMAMQPPPEGVPLQPAPLQ